VQCVHYAENRLVLEECCTTMMDVC